MKKEIGTAGPRQPSKMNETIGTRQPRSEHVERSLGPRQPRTDGPDIGAGVGPRQPVQKPAAPTNVGKGKEK